MIRVAEPLAWEVDIEYVFQERQLRLVPDGVAEAEVPSTADTARVRVGDALAGDAAASATTRRVAPEAVGSLAELVVSLRAGSDCLWCGGTLVGEGHDRLRLVCPSCGAEVETPESVHDGDVRL